MSRTFRFYLVAYVIPFVLIFLWAGRDMAKLARNYMEIRRLKLSLVKLTNEKERLQMDLTLLEKKDPVAWEELLRQQHALKPNEVEYRFK